MDAETHTDSLDPARAQAMFALLGRSDVVETGDPLPPFFHHLYFWQVLPGLELGRDGHPRLGGLIPDAGLPRRMWAAGSLRFHRPLLAGVRAEKTTHVESTARKTGRTGPLAFVRLRHEIRQRNAPCVSEWQELVYREEASPEDPKPEPTPAPADETVRISHAFDHTALFRYSALTMNGHRVHYDADYARDVEGYPDLVTHGPLLAQMLMLLAVKEQGALESFAYRAKAPSFVRERLQFCWRDGSMWVRGDDGRLCMEATTGQRL